MDEKSLISYINQNVNQKINIMEICGTHTHEIKRLGLESLLSQDINLISGPGCPVCVTSYQVIDLAIQLARENKMIVTFGDMIKVRGSRESLNDVLTEGYKVKVVYSPLDLFSVVENNKDEEIIFLGVGFETTVPIFASVIKSMKRLGIKNVSFLLSLKRMEPILKKILKENNELNGMIAPGHVAAITGSDYFKFITEEHDIVCAVCGFTGLDILSGIYFIMRNLKNPQFINLYPRVVRPLGNQLALDLINQVFDRSDSYWRGIGNVSLSGYQLKDEFEYYDSIKKYHLELRIDEDNCIKECACADVILGVKKPTDCLLFQSICHPRNPIGPCMASSEGTCLSYYQYGRNYG